MQEASSRPAVVLGLTFLLVALTFALPVVLIPSNELNLLSGQVSPEIANVYACVAWAGWAHFLFAFRGQSKALVGVQTGRLVSYAVCVLTTVLVLVGVRWAVGPTIFGAVVWLYFIDHFIKAEQSFEGKRTADTPVWGRWLSSYQALISFGWLSVVLLNVGGVNSRPWLLWTVSVLLGALVLGLGGWKNLAAGDIRGPLLSLFFIAESLVWGTFSRYGGPMFLTGVYVFHIAAGSYFHYLGSYFVASARAGARDRLLTPLSILAVNLGIVAIGYASAHWPAFAWLSPVLGVQWFSLWVGVHLVTSDLFPSFKKVRMEMKPAS